MHTFKSLLVPLVLIASSTVFAQQTPATSPAVAGPATGPKAGLPMTPLTAPDATATTAEPAAQPSSMTQPVIKKAMPLAPELPPQKILMRRVAMVEIPGRPGFDGVALVGGNLVMTHPAANTVDIFNVAKRRVTAQIKDMKGASGIAVDEQGGKAYVANTNGNDIAVISTKDWSVEKRISLKASPEAVLFVPELNLLLTSNWRDQSVSEIDLTAGAASRTVLVDGRPEYMAFDPNTKQIIVSLEDQNAIAVLDASLKVTKRINLVASQPTGMALDAKSRRLFVAVRYAVLALDADSGQELNRVAAPAGVDALWFEPTQGKLYAAAGGSVLVMNTKGRLEVEREWLSDVKGHTVAFDAQKNMLYLPGGRDGRSKLLMLRSMDKQAAEAASNGNVPTVGTVAEK